MSEFSQDVGWVYSPRTNRSISFMVNFDLMVFYIDDPDYMCSTPKPDSEYHEYWPLWCIDDVLYSCGVTRDSSEDIISDTKVAMNNENLDKLYADYVFEREVLRE